MSYKKFENIVKEIHEQNTCDEDNITDHTNMHKLRIDEWITPIK